jgi:peptide chain release factor
VISKEEALREEMRRLGIREEDIIERFVRSAGPGGQNVNKLSTCVYLKHRPTGIEVKCQKERSQGQNRYIARRILLAKITSRTMTAEAEERRKLEKLRRQKRLRPKGLKVRILEIKRRNSAKKKLRVRVRQEE